MREGLADVVWAMAKALSIRERADLESLKHGEVSILGRQVALEEVDWEEDYRPPLWAYHLHYFEGAVALACEARLGDREAYQALKQWVLVWIARCRPGRGPGWDPYPISQRVVNWAWIDLLLSGQYDDPELFTSLRKSVIQQTRFLAANIEYHLLANHLLKNAKALYLAGVVWPGAPEAQKWVRLGKAILEREIAEQILNDGGHFERTPMYHGAVLQDLLELQLITRAVEQPEFVGPEVVRKMLDFQADLTHPDGTRARFNDTFEGLISDAASVQTLGRLVDPEWSPPASRLVAYPETGYFGYRDLERGEVFVIDAGSPGPEHQPGHAHCDLLSFEFHSNGRPWIVDPGVHGYAGDIYRSYCRSTRAHNTLSIGGREQSEIWGSFRMARQARVEQVSTPALSGGRWTFGASYSPYFNKRAIHHRDVERKEDGSWLVRDRVAGSASGVEGALHFHPDVELSIQGDQLVCRRGNDALLVTGRNVGAWRLERGQSSPIDGWYFTAFGQARPATTARYGLIAPVSELTLRVRAESTEG